ncbi:MAG: hypothetical protein ACOCQA_03190 [bacterium]
MKYKKKEVRPNSMCSTSFNIAFKIEERSDFMNLPSLADILNYIVFHIYSFYLVVTLIISGLFSFFIDTEHAYLYKQYKDYLVSFSWGILNLSIAIILIIIKYIHTRFAL